MRFSGEYQLVFYTEDQMTESAINMSAPERYSC